MALSPSRWKRYAESRYPHEREALEYLRDQLPDQDPVFVYSNFEFIADDGSVNEVDALVITKAGVFLVEMKSRGGIITGNRHIWFWDKEGRVITIDSPLILANAKARKLKDLLGRQKSLNKASKFWIEPLVFCTDPSISIRLPDADRARVCARLPLDKQPGIMPALLRRDIYGMTPVTGTAIDKVDAKLILRALEEAGIRHAQRERTVGDYRLDELIEENPLLLCQDFAAVHPTMKALRRVRVYSYETAAAAADRERIKTAAQREYTVLDGLDHPGIVKALDFREHELGPAILFRREPDEVRLDHYLLQEGAKLTLDQRIDMVRQLAEALQYAHGRRVLHRALTPRSVLVSGAAAGRPQLRIFNWQFGRTFGTSLSPGVGLPSQHPARTTTLHRDMIEGSQRVYLAPEATLPTLARGETMDMFSLGAIAFLIFSGKSPALDIVERDQILRASQGLILSSVLDGAAPRLVELIHEATRGEVLARLDSVADFLKGLDAYEEEITRPDEEPTVDPLEAKPGDLLEGGYKVKQRLGAGSTAIALLVEVPGDPDPRERVLKIARRAEHNDRIVAEHAVLNKLRHPRIVAPDPSPLTINGHAGFLMERAGEETLAQRLQREGRLSLDLLQRFGEDLLEALEHLEAEGVSHRDLKPDNIGIAPYGKNKELHLKLFDFSLSTVPSDQIRVGTPAYLEPFLQLKERGLRWDTAAERFSAALVLYEMATGALPTWGDGQTAPHLIDAEATLQAELIDAAVREPLTDLFRTALKRDPKERHDNASDLRTDWHSAFATATIAESRQPDPDALHAAAAAAQLATGIAELPLSNRARNALDRVGVLTVADLLGQPSATFLHMRGVGNKTRKEIVDLLTLLRPRFPETPAPPSAPPLAETPEAQAAPVGPPALDDLLRQLIPAGRYREDQPHRQRLLRLLELDEGRKGDPVFPSQTEVANELGVTRAAISLDLKRARERWRRTEGLTGVRAEIAALLVEQGGVATVREIAELLLATRNDASDDPDLRLRRAAAVVRAALETERPIEKERRWEESRAHGLHLLALSGDTVGWAWRLVQATREIASADPLLSPARALETLRAVPGAPSGISDARLRRFAATAAVVSLSPRLELYPSGMPAARALRLAQSALAGLDRLSPAEIQARVRTRYPDAQPLPGRPQMDALLLECGLLLAWRPEEGLYFAPEPAQTTSSLLPERQQTRYTPRPQAPAQDLPPDLRAAHETERILETAYRQPSYLVLYTAPKLLRDAEKELRRRFPMECFDVDAELTRAMKDRARQVGADWSVVLRADAAPRGSQDWARLQMLLKPVVAELETRLRQRSGPVLLTYLGLLARYGAFAMLSAIGDAHMKHGLWVLVPGDQLTGRPTLDGVPVPAVGDNQAAELPPSWVRNLHRGGPSH